MQLKNKVFGKVGLVSPDYPPNTDIAQPKLVTTVNRDYSTMTLISNPAHTKH